MISLQVLLHYPITSKRNCLWLSLPPPTNSLPPQRRKIGSFPKNGCCFRLQLERKSFPGDDFHKDGILKRKGRKTSLLVVRVKHGFNSDNDGWDKSSSSRVLGNLALVIGLTYLTMTGQLGWLLDALVSIWLLAFLLPIVGLGAFFWFAGRDIIQSSQCPNCGNNFQIFKSSMNDGVQVCPFCTQPFSVEGNKFERESTVFSSKRSAAPKQVFNGSSPYSEAGTSAATVVDIEAEVKDIE